MFIEECGKSFFGFLYDNAKRKTLICSLYSNILALYVRTSCPLLRPAPLLLLFLPIGLATTTLYPGSSNKSGDCLRGGEPTYKTALSQMQQEEGGGERALLVDVLLGRGRAGLHIITLHAVLDSLLYYTTRLFSP